MPEKCDLVITLNYNDIITQCIFPYGDDPIINNCENVCSRLYLLSVSISPVLSDAYFWQTERLTLLVSRVKMSYLNALAMLLSLISLGSPGCVKRAIFSRLKKHR